MPLPLDSAVKGTQFLHLFLFPFLLPITQALDILRTPREGNLPAGLSQLLVLDQGHGLARSRGPHFPSLPSCGWGRGIKGAAELTGGEPALKVMHSLV